MLAECQPINSSSMKTPDIKPTTSLSQANPVQHFLSSGPSHKAHACVSHLHLQLADISSSNALPHGISSRDPNSNSNPNHSARFGLNTHFQMPFHLLYSNASCLSTEDETTDFQPCLISDKRLRRIISNRESAKRSRLRKKKQIEELQFQVDQLHTINNQLSQKLLHLLENNHQILQENALLKEKVAAMHMVLTDLLAPPRNSDEISRSTNQNFH